ncbi:MAG TPA: hypothetical protein VGN97_03755 [Mesorhizobium sp.]|jgi:hypothetical protein|nr:hypothetical protein [Mesorhizobium sp.]
MTTKRTCVCLAVGLAAAGCQTAGNPSPLAYNVAGGHQTLASCFAEAQPDAAFVVSDAPGDQTISVEVNASRPDAYRVAFAPVTETTTRVSAAQRGAAAPDPAWSQSVLPTLARCIRQMQG